MTLDLSQCSSPIEKPSSDNMDMLAFTQLQNIEDKNLEESVKELINFFEKSYSKKPKYVIKVPGRVNLIGEHVDYCGFPVCPMALNKHWILLAVGENDSGDAFIKINNINPKYNSGVVSGYSRELKISYEQQGWYSYVLCGIQGAIDKMVKDDLTPRNMLISVFGNIPPAVGLSSSTALVCSGFIATLIMKELTLTKIEISTLTAKAEHYIGTFGGGMDQAIVLNAKKGCCKLVKFNPVRLQDLPIPDRTSVVIANSLTEKNKAASNDFNTRVVECRIACQVLAKIGSVGEWQDLNTLAAVKKALDLSFFEIRQLIDKVFHSEPYVKAEICEILEISEDDLNKTLLTKDTLEVTSFKLKQRAKHVYEEAERVYMWRNWCSVGNKISDLGSLMQRSHLSLQHLYECSHPDVDKLVSIFTYSGAYGARLTGAGWGGCVVALIPCQQLDDILSQLQEMFYQPLNKDISECVIVAEPGDGAQIFTV